MKEASGDFPVNCSRASQKFTRRRWVGQEVGVDDRRLLPVVVRVTLGPSWTGPATKNPRREGSREFREAAPRFRRGRQAHLPGAGRRRSWQEGADGRRAGCGPCGG